MKTGTFCQIMMIFAAAIFWLASVPSSHAMICTYDDLNRLTAVQYPNGHVVQYDYDANGNMTAIRYITPADSDGDGLPDSWEQQIVDANQNDAIATFTDVLTLADFDGDGISNLIEYTYNTDPTDNMSPAIGDLNIDKEITLSDAIIALQIATGMDNGNAIGPGVSKPERKTGVADAIYILQVVGNMR